MSHGYTTKHVMHLVQKT